QRRSTKAKQSADKQNAVGERIAGGVVVRVQRRAFERKQVVADFSWIGALGVGAEGAGDQGLALQAEQVADDQDAVGEGLSEAVGVNVQVGAQRRLDDFKLGAVVDNVIDLAVL